MEKEDKKIDRLLKREFKTIAVEKAPDAFLQKVMSRIAEEKNTIVYQPSSFRFLKIGIAVAVTVLISLALIFDFDTTALIDFSRFKVFSFQELPSWKLPFDFIMIPKGMAIGILMAVVLLVTQFLVLKNYFTKQYAA